MKQRKTEESEIVSEPIDVDKVTSEVLTQPDDPPSPPLRVSVIKRKDREEIGEPLSHQGSLSLGEGTYKIITDDSFEYTYLISTQSVAILELLYVSKV